MNEINRTWFSKWSFEFFLSLCRVSSGFIHQIQRFLECTLPVDDRRGIIFGISGDSSRVRFLYWSSSSIFSSSSLCARSFSLLFLTCSKDLLLNNFIFQLECKYIPSGPFSQLTLSKASPKVSKPHQFREFSSKLFHPSRFDLHSSWHSSVQRRQREPSFLFLLTVFGCLPLSKGWDIFNKFFYI